MKTIYFSGGSGDTFTARYKIITRRSKNSHFKEVVIFVVQKLEDGLSLLNSAIGRAEIINRILDNDLSGIELKNIRFVWQWQSDSYCDRYRHCWEFFLDFDFKDVPHWREPRSFLTRLWCKFRRKDTYVCWSSRDVLAGKTKVISNFESRAFVSEEEVMELLKACDESDPTDPPTMAPGLRAVLNTLPSPNSLT